MKAKLILLTILVLGFAIFVFIRFFVLNSQNEFGRIKIVSSPTTSVFIDNVAVGKTPFEEKYKVGEYMLKLIPEGSATDTASWQGKIQVYRNALTYVNRELGSSDITSAGEIFTTTKMDKAPSKSDTGEIYVETEPEGAIVYLDNDEKSVSPLLMSDVPKGDHELSVFMPNFLRRTQKVNVDPGYRVNASFKLAIDQTQQATTSATPAPGVSATTGPTPTGAATKISITIKDTPTGFLRVRAEPTVNASEEAQVKPGEKYDALEEKNGWYRINYQGKEEGWVSGQYVEKN